MKCYTGIDLGSTTTKAVVLDADGHVLGRGITNSRSNYDVACDVARAEALTDARFNLFGHELGDSPRLAERRDDFLALLRRNFRLEQYLVQLGHLGERCVMLAERMEMEGARMRPVDAVKKIFEDMHTEAANLFAPGAKLRSDFFRDLAGSRYAALAKYLARQKNLDFEALIGVYDKSIIPVENTIGGSSFQTMLDAAVRRTLSDGLVSGMESELEHALSRTLATNLIEAVSVGTGYGRARLPFPKERIRSEILCHGLGAHATFPDTRTVLDIGGQDTKAIQVDEHGVVTSFQMNDRCAAGCGRYLGYIAEEMNLGLHELGPMAMQSKRTVRINSTCTVFAGAELRDRLSSGQRREDILDGLHRAIMLRAMSLLARSGGVANEFSFTGGVAKNPAAVRALRGLVQESYGDRTINISPESIYMGALGAAIFALREHTPGKEVLLTTSGGTQWS
ncbi:MAG: benzoyl-CoA reductase subunit A [Planctomycetes bacterium]|nr:benzoyl-CoA reductase subunit A [Planctomycetota bacterium]